METLIECTCGHPIGNHRNGCGRRDCPCTRSRADVLDAAVAAVRLPDGAAGSFWWHSASGEPAA